jgi:murein DD-endopeptidase MepM/ murein hydrolase activator NlpD
MQNILEIQLNYPCKAPISQYFGENPVAYAKWDYPGHNGLDLAAPFQTLISPVYPGKVEKIAYESGGYGIYIVIAHCDGLFRTYYCHLDRVLVPVSALVTGSDAIAQSGSSGFSTGPHLHLGLRIATNLSPQYKGYIDPLPYLQGPAKLPVIPWSLPDAQPASPAPKKRRSFWRRR